MYTKFSCFRNPFCFHLQFEVNYHGAFLIYNSYRSEIFSSPSLSSARNFSIRSPPPFTRQHTSIPITAHHLSYTRIKVQFFVLPFSVSGEMQQNATYRLVCAHFKLKYESMDNNIGRRHPVVLKV